MSNGSRNIVLCGVGGQGTILASRLIARAAMDAGIPVLGAETIGMAQRGGSVLSHVRLGEASSPLIGEGMVQLLIAFEPAEAARQLRFLAPDGVLVVSTRPLVPVSSATGGPAYDLDAIMAYLRSQVPPERLIEVDATKASEALGSAKCLNVVLLGAAVSSGALGLAARDVLAAIHALVPARFLELNLRALSYMKGLTDAD